MCVVNGGGFVKKERIELQKFVGYGVDCEMS